MIVNVVIKVFHGLILLTKRMYCYSKVGPPHQ